MEKQQCIGFLNTPPLWHNEQFGIRQFKFPEIHLTAFQPQPIPQHIRLGHQMEYVFKQLVAYSEAYEVVLHNLPIRQRKQTMGEIDFILKDKASQKLIHVELTYKFYIIDPEIIEPIHQLVGPNKHDAFFAKMQKIKNQQFPLLHSEEGANALYNNNIDHLEIEHQCCFKAQLFQPYGSAASTMHPLNEICIVGYWLRFDAFNTSEFKSYQFYIPSKSEWVIAPHHQVVWQSYAEIGPEVKLRMDHKKSPMLWMKKSDTAFEKMFVVW